MVGSFAGSVWYYDLDQKKPEERALIDSNDTEGSCVSGFKTYTDHDTPGLHFNLAMRTKCAYANYNLSFRGAQVLLNVIPSYCQVCVVVCVASQASQGQWW